MATATPRITTTEMHTGGEPLRIVETGYPKIHGETILDKRQYALDNLDHIRRLLMYEPRGHYDMYGAIIVKPDHPEAHLAALFMHNAGYSTMCGHAVIALGRYAVDKGLVKMTEPETIVKIQCPCGLVTAMVDCSSGAARRVRFRSVPAFTFALDVAVEVPGIGHVKVDIGYGGAFYAVIDAKNVGCDVRKTPTKDLKDVATRISEATRVAVTLRHPYSADLAFLYGTILTDGRDPMQTQPTYNVCVFADNEVDRSPTGSGVTARLALQYSRGLIGLNQPRDFGSITNSIFRGKVADVTSCGEFDAIIAEVEGEAFYTGQSVFTTEDRDTLAGGFLLS